MRNAFFLLMLLLTGAASMQAQNAEDIIAKHVSVMGGDNWKKLQSIKMEAKVTVQNAPGMEIPITMYVVRDKSLRMDVSVMGMTQTSVVNGDGGWMINPFAGQTAAEPLTADQVKEMKDMTDIDGTLNGYKERGYKIEYVGTEDVDGTEAHKIKVDKGGGRLEYAFIDKEKFYEIKSLSVTNVDGKEVQSETVYSNFQTVDGMVFPGTMEQENPMMGASVTTFTNFSINPAIDNTLFDMPKK